jgi:hypothetical protein
MDTAAQLHPLDRDPFLRAVARMSALAANRTRRDGGNDVNDPGCVKTLRGIPAPGILGSTVTRSGKKRKNLSSARHYDQIRFRFHTAKTQSAHARPRIAVVQTDINRSGGNTTGVTIPTAPTADPRQSSSHEGEFDGNCDSNFMPVVSRPMRKKGLNAQKVERGYSKII